MKMSRWDMGDGVTRRKQHKVVGINMNNIFYIYKIRGESSTFVALVDMQAHARVCTRCDVFNWSQLACLGNVEPVISHKSQSLHV